MGDRAGGLNGGADAQAASGELAGEGGERSAMVQGDEGVEVVGGLREDGDGVGGVRGGEKAAKGLGWEEGGVDGEKEVPVGEAVAKGGDDAAERALEGGVVGDEGGEAGEGGGASGDLWRRGDGAEGAEGVGDQGFAVEQDEGLVGAHAGALASGEDEGGGVEGIGHCARGVGLWVDPLITVGP